MTLPSLPTGFAGNATTSTGSGWRRSASTGPPTRTCCSRRPPSPTATGTPSAVWSRVVNVQR
ncbi:hypothetical protein GXW82_24105 [Streptacidiphilus sp. 4-A2]|nr:hypothetical protein [Streptacidiphilus sp. 4-A2]